jgi:oxygen-dependent protoporphyrinogen oxidase
VASSDLDVVVLGAGIAGLAAALALQAAGRDVAVLEAGDAPGGVMRTDRIRGYTVERGPSLFRVSAEAGAFLASHGLAEALLAAGPEARLRSLLVEGRLVPVPASLAGAATTPLLSARGKLRILAEPFVRRGDPTGESVAEFVARRLGAEALDRLVVPFLVGVYAGDETKLGAEAVFPSLVAFERVQGSIARGALADAIGRARASGAARRGSFSTREGAGGLARALAERLGTRVRTGTPARAIARESDGLSIETDAGSWRARKVVVALPAWRAAELLRPLDAALGEGLARIAYAPIASVALGLDPDRLRTPVRGVGFLVPRREGLDLLGALFTSRVFPERAPAARELATCLLGGARWPEAAEADDAALAERAAAGLDRALGLRGAPETIAIARWPRAIPQPGRDHPRQVADLRARAARLGLALAGGYLDGVAVSDALVSGVRAAVLTSG